MPDPILPEPADFRPPRARRAGRPLSASARRRARRRRVLAFSAAGAIVLVGVGGGVALAATNDGGQRYRTATVVRASVEQQIDSVGTIASAQRRDMAFSVAGTVGAVAVKVGDAVKAGQTLATLDPASLQDAIDSANSALATAQQQLSDDLASQTSSTSTSTSSSSTSSSTTSSSSARSSSSASSAADTSSASSGRTGTSTQGSSAAQDPAVTSAASAVHDAQQALLAQADKADVALKASSEAVTTSQTTCQALLDLTATSSSSSGSDPTPSPSPSPSESPSPSASPSASSGSSSGSDSSTIATALKACQDAIAAAQTAQKATSDAQAQLTALSGRLDQAVAAYQKALEQAARSSSTGTGQQGGASTPSTGSGTSTPSTGSSTSSSSSSGASRSSSPSASSAGGSFSGGGSTSSGPASAATILADRAAVTTAQANVEVATSKSDLATLTSPFAGTVAAVSMKVGDSVAASSSSEVITVIGTDGYTVTTSVPLSRIDIVKVGQDATVTTPSAKGSLAGKVTSIGVLDVSTTSDPAYQVQIALGGGDQPIYNGASAQVQISVAGASQVLTVPTSAVHVESGAATVDVLQNGKPVTVSVKRGAVGTDRTEITSGLKLGDQVVLADLQATIQSSSSSTNRGLSSLGGSQTSQFGGQFPGGGFGGGGFGGGGFGGGGFTGGGFGGQGGGKG